MNADYESIKQELLVMGATVSQQHASLQSQVSFLQARVTQLEARASQRPSLDREARARNDRPAS